MEPFHACFSTALLSLFINFFLFYSAQMYISFQCQCQTPITLSTGFYFRKSVDMAFVQYFIKIA